MTMNLTDSSETIREALRRLAEGFDTLTPLAKKGVFRYLGYWIGVTGVKPRGASA